VARRVAKRNDVTVGASAGGPAVAKVAG